MNGVIIPRSEPRVTCREISRELEYAEYQWSAYGGCRDTWHLSDGYSLDEARARYTAACLSCTEDEIHDALARCRAAQTDRVTCTAEKDGDYLGFDMAYGGKGARIIVTNCVLMEPNTGRYIAADFADALGCSKEIALSALQEALSSLQSTPPPPNYGTLIGHASDDSHSVDVYETYHGGGEYTLTVLVDGERLEADWLCGCECTIQGKYHLYGDITHLLARQTSSLLLRALPGHWQHGSEYISGYEDIAAAHTCCNAPMAYDSYRSEYRCTKCGFDPDEVGI